VQLAKEIGLVNNSYVSDVELNKFIPSEDKLELWARALEVPWEVMKDMLLEHELEELGISDPSFTMMFKEIPNMTYEEKQSIIRAFEIVLKMRASKNSKKDNNKEQNK
jgi:transcriptional regulator with XRE-family HTH domain